MTSQHRAPTTARLYMDHGPTIHLAGLDDYAQAQQAVAAGSAVIGTTTDGDEITVPYEHVQSVVRPKADMPLDVTAIFHGRKVTVRSLAAHNHDAVVNGEPHERHEVANEGEWVVVTAQDMADAVVLVCNPQTGEILWANPASPDDAITKTQQAVRLLAEAEQLVVNMYSVEIPEPTPVVHQTDSEQLRQDLALGLTDDQINAKAWLIQKGTIKEAIATADEAFVLAYLVESASGPDVCVKLTDSDPIIGGSFGVITAYDESKGIRLGLFGPASGDVPEPWLPLSDIEGVVSWSWDDYGQTGDRERFLTEFGREQPAAEMVTNIRL